MANEKHSKLRNLLFGNENVLSIIPGFLLAIIVMLVAVFMTKAIVAVLPWQKNPLSPLLVAIVLGLVIRNAISLPEVFNGGIKFVLKKFLRFGIILMGIRLSIFAVLTIGVLAVGMVIVCITAALVSTMFLAKKIGISEKLGTLIAAGTSICGVSAIVATSPTIESSEEETAYAVGTIAIFGMIATIVYPYLTELILHLPVESCGFFLGTSVHDTSQVTATALIYDQLWANKAVNGLMCSDIAITTKLVRNTFMVAIVPLLGFWFARKNAHQGSGRKIQVMNYIPLFVFGYVAMAIMRSLGDYAFSAGKDTLWYACWHFVEMAATYVIAVSVAGIGLNTDIKKLAKLGYKPFICGLIAAFSVGAVSWLLVTQFGDYLQF